MGIFEGHVDLIIAGIIFLCGIYYTGKRNEDKIVAVETEVKKVEEELETKATSEGVRSGLARKADKEACILRHDGMSQLNEANETSRREQTQMILTAVADLKTEVGKVADSVSSVHKRIDDTIKGK